MGGSIWTTRTRTSSDGTLYLSCADTAKLVRKKLREKFPGVKFSVRSSNYSGGASITVRWTDGPLDRDVQREVDVYAGAQFDGMIDLKTHRTHWIEPDGTAYIARAQGSASYDEKIGDPRSGEARLCSFGADYILTSRDVSDEFKKSLVPVFEKVYGEPYDETRTYTEVASPYGRLHFSDFPETGSTLLYRLAHQTAEKV